MELEVTTTVDNPLVSSAGPLSQKKIEEIFSIRCCPFLITGGSRGNHSCALN